MSVKALLETSILGKLAYTVACAALIGGGTVVLSNQSRIAVIESESKTQDGRLERIENKIDKLLERTHQ